MDNIHKYPWHNPELRDGDPRPLMTCGYCGSMHPGDLAEAIKAGARLDWADFKYGWPHKVYVEGIPNPHAGMLESRFGSSHATPTCPKTMQPCAQGEQSSHRPQCECMLAGTVTHGSTSGGIRVVLKQDGFDQVTGKPTHTWRGEGEPAATTTSGKFYSVHLQDAAPEDREVIERAMGRSFVWREGKVWYGPYTQGGLTIEMVREQLQRQQQA